MPHFSPGDRVIIKSNVRGAYAKKDLIGRYGLILNAGYNPKYPARRMYCVQIDGERNSYSVTGGFWFTDQDLVLSDTADKIKEDRKMLPGYTAAAVQFISGSNKDKTYFYALYDRSVMPGDLVVVSTGHHGLALARIASIEGSACYVTDNREVVCQVDTGAWEARKKKAEKLQQLKDEMDERVKAYQAVALYEMAAEKDPELKSLLAQSKALQEE